MSWNYRILSEVVGDYTEYFIAEVYYNKDGNPEMWSDREEFNALRGWDDVNDLRATIAQVQEALNHPVLRVFGDRLVAQ